MADRSQSRLPSILRSNGPYIAYREAVAYLVANGWRREELGSGWWWKEDCHEEATLGGALEQQLEADGIDQRDTIPGEPEKFWG